jgi:hypothetical protein
LFDGEIMEALPDVELMWHERIERKYFQQGVILGKQEFIVYYLKHKFGGLPDGIVGKVEAVDDSDKLDELFDQIYDADSLAEVKLLA